VGWIAGLSVLVGAAGLGLGYLAYARQPYERERDVTLSLGPVSTLLVNKYYLDDLYLRGIVFPIRDRVSAGVNWINQNVLDGMVHGAALLARGFSWLVNRFDLGVIDGAVNGAGGVTGATGGRLRYVQSGNVQFYLALLLLSLLGLLGVAIVVVR
jgi:NADH:ubiquinone oxidoreductase subunit 5 (subunit L)/multisubunit Na+/H+ antiporter MnhA subunit